jgi:hypothetical protein
MKKKEQIELLEHRFNQMEQEHLKLLVRCAKLESEVQMLKQDKDYQYTNDGDIY